jgi:hypothetical protein
MIDRRQLLTVGGLLGALSTDSPDEGVASAVGQMSDRNIQDLVNAIKSVTTAITSEQSNLEILPVRKSQTEFLRANGKFPDFIDVGVDAWTAVYDWHVRMQQPLVLGRDATGRYTLMLGFTALVLKPDAVPGLIGIPYDNR